MTSTKTTSYALLIEPLAAEASIDEQAIDGTFPRWRSTHRRCG